MNLTDFSDWTRIKTVIIDYSTTHESKQPFENLINGIEEDILSRSEAFSDWQTFFNRYLYIIGDLYPGINFGNLVDENNQYLMLEN